MSSKVINDFFKNVSLYDYTQRKRKFNYFNRVLLISSSKIVLCHLLCYTMDKRIVLETIGRGYESQAVIFDQMHFVFNKTIWRKRYLAYVKACIAFNFKNLQSVTFYFRVLRNSLLNTLLPFLLLLVVITNNTYTY